VILMSLRLAARRNAETHEETASNQDKEADEAHLPHPFGAGQAAGVDAATRRKFAQNARDLAKIARDTEAALQMGADALP
jgi:hypothetical protein